MSSRKPFTLSLLAAVALSVPFVLYSFEQKSARFQVFELICPSCWQRLSLFAFSPEQAESGDSR